MVTEWQLLAASGEGPDAGVDAQSHHLAGFVGRKAALPALYFDRAQLLVEVHPQSPESIPATHWVDKA